VSPHGLVTDINIFQVVNQPGSSDKIRLGRLAQFARVRVDNLDRFPKTVEHHPVSLENEVILGITPGKNDHFRRRADGVFQHMRGDFCDFLLRVNGDSTTVKDLEGFLIFYKNTGFP
jgi:hypothetical protein